MGLSTESRNEIIVSCVMFALATIVIAARFVSIKFTHCRAKASHILTAIAWVLLLGLVVEIVLWATIGGNGKHAWQMSASQTETFYELFYANQINYFCLSPMIKLSICFFYRHIFSSVKMFNVASSIVAILLSCWGIAITVAGIFQCTPIQYFWNPNIEGHCVNQNALLYGIQYSNIVFDFILLGLPLPVIWQIKTTVRHKLQLVGVFTLGGVGCVAGIVRVIMLGQMKSSDVPYTIYQATVWTLVEPCIALMCGSLPIVRGAIRIFMEKRRQRSDASHLDFQKPKSTLIPSSNRTITPSSSTESASYIPTSCIPPRQSFQRQSQTTARTRTTQPLQVYVDREFSVESQDRGPSDYSTPMQEVYAREF